MKKVLLFFATSMMMAMSAMAQFQIQSDGEIRFTPSTTNAWTNHMITFAGNEYAKNYIVTWDGYQRFYVLGSGYAVSRGNYLTSDARLKQNIQDLKTGSSIYQLSPKSYYLKDSLTDKSVDGKILQYGFLAQDVREIFPNLVFEDEKGMLSLNYVGMIPLLVETIKQQHEDIENLKEQLAATSKEYALKSDSESLNIKSAITTQATLSQNKPNPFSTNTRIEMVIPETVSEAVLYIYDLQGKQLKSITVSGRGATSETIFGNELQAGMYIYSLVTDGKLVGSKQMILTE